MSKYSKKEKLSKDYIENLKGKPLDEQPYINKRKTYMKETGLTWKSIVIVIVMAVLKLVLPAVLPESITPEVLVWIEGLLESILYGAGATALWGIRRRIPK